MREPLHTSRVPVEQMRQAAPLAPSPYTFLRFGGSGIEILLIGASLEGWTVRQ